jgi:hypothetical protein
MAWLRVATSLAAVLISAQAAGPEYVGAEACGACHATEFAGQSRSGHARALARSAANQPGDWAFGAGLQAITFVSRVDRETYREHGETWYRASNAFGMTPGHRDAAGLVFRLFDPEARILRCFACHSTGPVEMDAGQRVAPHELGVRCEVCHGPGAAHASDPVKSRMRIPPRAKGADVNGMCADCHRLELGTEAENKDLRDPRNSRNQPLMLAASACFRGSNGRLSCFTCHAPHAELEQKPAAYDRICQGCHASPRHGQAVAGRACADCHMPGVRYSNLVFVNHRIGIYAAGNAVTPVSVRR